LSQGTQLFMNDLFFCKIDIALESFYCFGVCNGLSEPSRDCERVRTGLCRAIEVFSFESLGVNWHWSRFMIFSFGNPLFKFLVWKLLCASVDSSFNNQLIVALFHSHLCAVLCTHNLLANHICSQVFFSVCISTRCVKDSLWKFCFLINTLLTKLFQYLCFDLFLNQMRLAADSWDIVSRVKTCTPDTRGGVSCWALDGTVNAIGRVIKLLFCVYWVLEVKMALRNVLLLDGPTKVIIWNFKRSGIMELAAKLTLISFRHISSVGEFPDLSEK